MGPKPKVLIDRGEVVLPVDEDLELSRLRYLLAGGVRRRDDVLTCWLAAPSTTKAQSEGGDVTEFIYVSKC